MTDGFGCLDRLGRLHGGNGVNCDALANVAQL